MTSRGIIFMSAQGGQIFFSTGGHFFLDIHTVLMADSLSTNLLSKFISFFPTYKATNLMIESLQGEIGNINDIIFCLVTIFVCYIINYSILIKKDAVKLCDITS